MPQIHFSWMQHKTVTVEIKHLIFPEFLFLPNRPDKMKKKKNICTKFSWQIHQIFESITNTICLTYIVILQARLFACQFVISCKTLEVILFTFGDNILLQEVSS